MTRPNVTRRDAVGFVAGGTFAAPLFSRLLPANQSIELTHAAPASQVDEIIPSIKLEQGLRQLRQSLRLPIGPEVRNNSFSMTGTGWSHDRPAISCGFDGSALDEPVIVFDRPPTNDASNNAQVVLSNFAVLGGFRPAPQAGSQHGFFGTVNSLDARNLLVQYLSGHGWHLEDSYSNRFANGLMFENFGNGMHFRDTANNVVLDGVRAFGNGRSWTQEQGNIVFDCRRSPAYGSSIRDCDVSYSGYEAFSYANTKLGSVRVHGGKCTVTTVEEHGLPADARVFCKGSPELKQTEAIAVEILDRTRFAFPTHARDGSYQREDHPALAFGPYSHGLLLVGTSGCRIDELYAEDCRGPAARISNSEAITVSGGFVLNCDLIVEECRGVEIGGIKFQGTADLVTRERTDRAEINVLSSNVFSEGARWVRGNAFMRDGIRYVSSQPRTGDWQTGEFALRWNAGPADPFAYLKTASGWAEVGDIGNLPLTATNGG